MLRQFFKTLRNAQSSGPWTLGLLIIGVLALGIPFAASIASAKTVEKMGAPDLPNVYGIVAVYEMEFNRPWTQSGHTVWVGNNENFDLIYTYEFQHGIRGFNDPLYEDKKLREGRTLDRGDWLRDDDYQGLNVNNLPGLVPDMDYTVDVYTRFEAYKERVPRKRHSWRVDDWFEFTR